MTHATEKLDIMDTITTFRKQKHITVTKTLAIGIFALFIACLILTGLLVHYLAPKEIEIKEIAAGQCNRTITSTYITSESEEPETEIVETTTTLTTTLVPTNTTRKSSPRLPRSVIPHSYVINLIPFIYEGNFTFQGNVSIVLNVTEATKYITLHADELEVVESSVRVLRMFEGSRSYSEVGVREIRNDSKMNFLIVRLQEELESGAVYEISMNFAGILNDVLQGFYRSSYTVNKEKRWIAATQFQPTDARKAFPCFDEPALKATFQLNIGRLKNMSTISNMPKVGTTDITGLGGYVWDHFQNSVPMSTYLVAFVVSDLDYVKNGSLAIWTRESAISQAKFGLEIGPAILKYYEDFFQIKFPLPKIDMVALPDFSTGAMENWGLITYRESVLLYEKGVSTILDLQNVAVVIAHELAHQWFGNLVTPSWWTDLWLNEGFASYLEYIGVDAVRPDWKFIDQFVVLALQTVFQMDSLKSSHQISIEVNNPDEINVIFDSISYGKGATIIRMMEHFLTTDVFKKGLTTYLNERKYSSADQDDLWLALTNQAQKDNIFDENTTVKEIMDTWTLQTGFPVVTVTRNYDDATASLTQERFLLTGERNSTERPLWWIPITYNSRLNSQVKKLWMKAEPDVTVALNVSSSEWLLLNVNQTGYYRVNYDSRNWQLIIDELNNVNGYKKFDPKNRAQLLNDALNLAKAGHLDYGVALNLTKYLINEREYVPWKAAFNAFDFLYEVFVRSGQFDKYKTYILHLINGLYRDIGFIESPNDPILKIRTRMIVLRRACLLGFRDCIINSVKQFEEWRNSADPDHFNPISPNLRSIVYCHAIKVGGQEEWDFAWQRYLHTDVSSEKDLIMNALGCSTETWILTRYLEWAITEGSGIRKQDSVRVFGSVSSGIIGQQLTYKFFTTNWDKIKKYMGSSLTLLLGVIRESILSLPSEQEINDIKAFVASKREELAFASRVIQQSLEEQEANLEWKNKNLEKIVDWLTAFHNSS